MSKKKKIILFILVFIVILGLIGGTYAYWSWVTSEEQKTQVTFTATAGFSCSADMGGSIKSGDSRIIPTTVSDTTRGNYVKRELVVNPVITETGKTIYMDLWLDINSLGTALSNSTNFRYALTTSSNSPTTGVVSSGNFNGRITGNKVYLLDLKEYTKTTEEAITDTYYLWIWLDATETNIETANQEFALSLNGNCYDDLPITVNSLINNANPSTLSYTDASDSQKAEMWTFSHDATEQVAATTDYRYIGSSPNNYITFNDEIWRIIGVFDGSIKIIRNESIGSMPWDYKQSGVGSSTSDNGSNDWTDSQIMYMLNPTSYKLKDGYTSDGTYIYDGSGNIIYQLGCQPASIASGDTSYSCTSNTWSLNSTSLSQIGEATYYLGGSSSYTGHSATSYYTLERGTDVYSERQSNWTGLVGLMYPSDYAYTFANGVDDTCYTDTYNCNTSTPSSSWLYKSDSYQWTVTPKSNVAYHMFYITSAGIVHNNYRTSYTIETRPVVYLKFDIKLQGTGTSDNPYVIIN